MTKYLDQNGLAYFWTKIKAWLSSHAPVKYFGQNWVEDTNDDYALVVGNGADENNPENVFAIEHNGIIRWFLNEIDENLAPGSSQFVHLIEGYDNTQNGIGYVEIRDGADGYRGIGIKAHRKVNDTSMFHGVQMQMDSSGNKRVDFDDKVAWQNALNNWLPLSFVNKTEDVDFTKANNNVGTNYYPCILFTDLNDRYGVRLENVVLTDGKVGFYLYGQNFASDGTSLPTRVGIKGLINKSGVAEYIVDNNDKFRNALGASSGIWPISLGGTGCTGVIENRVVSDVITPRSGITITNVFTIKWGKVLWIRVSWKRNSAISVPANGNMADITIGDLKNAYRPLGMTVGIGEGNDPNTNASYIIGWDGPFSVESFEATGSARTIPANTELTAYSVYLLG